MQTPDPLSQTLILKNLNTKHVGREILVLESTASTNDAAWEYASRADSDGLCIFAETQTAGRGRRGRVWHSGKNDSLLFSILLQNCPLKADILTLASAVAAAECLTKQYPLNLQIKWPNDVLIENRKVCGILTESRKVHSQSCFVIGIGINVRQKRDFFASLQLDTPATSLSIETDTVVDRNELAVSVLNSLDHWLSICRYAPQQVGQVWKYYNRQIGSQIRLLENQQECEGTCLDIDPAKGLVVQLNHGPIRLFHAANCTVLSSDS